MKASEVPADLRRFILTSIPSVPFLEAVLLLREQPRAPWDAPMLARRLYVPEKRAVELLQSLSEAGIAHCPADGDALFAYEPASPELAGLLDRLAQAYASNLVGVSDLIHSRIDKQAQHFADAFRWRKENG